ncbi:MAG TPA: DNA repair protein RecO [Dehalococcoidia bacterium]|nr:DNA repair protein RecO [Dehalococcoidia bacterium]
MPAARLYKTEAIVLRQRRLGEADRILTLYSPAYGKLDAKAKGVRKTTSRMAGHLQPLTRCLVQLAQGRASDVVAGCETLESFQALREDLDRLSRALYAAELVDRFTPERVPGFVTYRLLQDTLRRLETAAELDLAVRHFEMALLDQAGFRPELERCVGCGGALEPVPNHFSPQSGGVLCPSCGQGPAEARPLSVNGLKVLRLLQRRPYKEIAGLNLPRDVSDEVERHLRSYIVAVLERDVNAASFIERLRREARSQAVEVSSEGSLRV